MNTVNTLHCVLPADQRDRRKFHWSVWPSLAYEAASWLESLAKLSMAARQWQTAFWSLRHTKHCMVHQHLDTTNETGVEYGQNGGSQNTKCLSSPSALVSHKVQRGRCRGIAGLANLSCSKPERPGSYINQDLNTMHDPCELQNWKSMRRNSGALFAKYH